MENNVVISVNDINKSFKVYFDKGFSLKEKVLFKNRNRFENHHVLNGVSFDVKKGEAIALIGENGCGKSTTLKLLSRIMFPDSGFIEMNGRVSALIELGAGFHPDMSGRENIYTNAAIFGLSRKEIDRRIQAIIDFSELGEYIDNPVRTYSSGMYMRLAFSVAINVDADILLIDEILAVGDAAFQAKCFNKMREIKAKGTTIVLVSHSMGQVEQVCDRCIWLNQGLIEAEGTPREVTPKYLEYMAQKDNSCNANDEFADGTVPVELDVTNEIVDNNQNLQIASRANPITIVEAQICDDAWRTIRRTSSGKKLYLSVTYEASTLFDEAVAGFSIYRNDGICCYGSSTQIDGMSPFRIEKGTHKMTVSLPEGKLLSGKYCFDWALAKPSGEQIVYIRNIIQVEIISKTQEIGLFAMDHEWKID